MSDSREGDTLTAPPFRVCMGWSAFEDFEALPEALERAASLLRTPVTSPLFAEVSINVAPEPGSTSTLRPTIFTAECEIAPR